MKKIILIFLTVLTLLCSPISAQSSNSTSAQSYQSTFNQMTANALTVAEGCFVCPIFDLFFKAGNKMVAILYPKLQKALIPLFLILAACWLGWMVFQNFLNLAENTEDIYKQLFKIFLTVSFGYTLLSANVNTIFEWFINPIIQTGMNIANLIAGTLLSGPSTCSPNASFTNTPLDMETYKTLFCPLYNTSVSLTDGLLIGGTLMGKSFFVIWILPYLPLFFPGLLYFLFYFCLMFAFPMKLLDILARLFIVLTLTPLYVFFWTFPLTRKYTKNALHMLLIAMTSIIALFVLVNLGLSMVQSATASGSLQQKYNYLRNGDFDEDVVKSWNLMGDSSFFVVIAALFIAWRCLDMSSAIGAILTDEHSGDAIGNVLGKGGAATFGKMALSAKNAPKNLKNMAKNAKKTVQNIKNAPANFKKTMSNIKNNAKKDIMRVLNPVKTAKDIGAALKQRIKDTKESAKNLGKRIGYNVTHPKQALKNGIKMAWEKFKDRIR